MFYPNMNRKRECFYTAECELGNGRLTLRLNFTSLLLGRIAGLKSYYQDTMFSLLLSSVPSGVTGPRFLVKIVTVI